MSRMYLDQPFLKLSLRFCADTLATELDALPESAWTAHPTGFVGNEAVRLITPGGQATDAFDGPMGPTEHLLACPYTMAVMAEIGGVWGRSRYMGLAPGAEVPPHVDSQHYFRTRYRVHIPVITNSEVVFTCGGETVHMAAGECWMFNSFERHEVRNGGSERRVHLVVDTVMTERLHAHMQAARDGAPVRELRLGEANPAALKFEQVNTPRVMSPWEMRQHVAFLMENVVPAPVLEQVRTRLDRLVAGWTGLWAQFGDGDAGLSAYRRMVMDARHDLALLGGERITLRNGKPLYSFIDHLIFYNAAAGDRAKAPAPQSQQVPARRLAC